MISRNARAILSLVHDGLVDLEGEFGGAVRDRRSATWLAVASLLIDMRLRLIFMVADDPDVFRAATALDSRWRALLPEIERRREAPGGDA